MTAVKTPILIYCRLKPQNSGRIEDNQEYSVKKSSDKDILTIISHQTKCTANNKPNFYNFRFAKVFDQSASQEIVYNTVASPIVQSALTGYNGTIFAYGQTGSGKTYTISGDENGKGIIPRAFSDIFTEINRDKDTKFEVHISYLEIYNEQSNDLLSPLNEERKKISLREDHEKVLQWHNLQLCPVYNFSEAMALLEYGDSNRIVSDTPMNVYSSRSHTILTIYLTAHVQETLEIRKAKLNLVDLAGSERVHKTGEEGIVLEEARHINLSLHYLQQVIVALSDTSRLHVPYRNCALTAALRDSLGGNSKTAMIANISLEKSNGEETISTCRFAQRVALVGNEVFLNVEKDLNEENLQLKEEIILLKNECSNLKEKLWVLEQKPNNDGEDFSIIKKIQHETYEEELTDSSYKLNNKLTARQLKKDIINLICWFQEESKGNNLIQTTDDKTYDGQNCSVADGISKIRFEEFAVSLPDCNEWLNAKEENQSKTLSLSVNRKAIASIHKDILNLWKSHEKTLVQEMLTGLPLKVDTLINENNSPDKTFQDHTFDSLLQAQSDLLKDFQLLRARLRHTERCLQRIQRKYSLEFFNWRKSKSTSKQCIIEINKDYITNKRNQTICDELLHIEKLNESECLDSKQMNQENKSLSLVSEGCKENDLTNYSNYSIFESDINTTFGDVDDSRYSTSTQLYSSSNYNHGSTTTLTPRLCCSVPSMRWSSNERSDHSVRKPRGLHTLNSRHNMPPRTNAKLLLTGDVDIDQEILAFYHRS